MGFAAEYAELGYTNPRKGILFANWNYFSYDAMRLLERYGYECEWEDEWYTCDECGKAFRISPDPYGWQPSYFMPNDCEMFCIDCIDMEEYLKGLENNPRRALNDHIDPANYGYCKLEGDFEAGFHLHQDNNPREIFKRLNAAGHTRLLFNVDSVGQFDLTFSVWEKIPESEA
jgi:hypothetical protein